MPQSETLSEIPRYHCGCDARAGRRGRCRARRTGADRCLDQQRCLSGGAGPRRQSRYGRDAACDGGIGCLALPFSRRRRAGYEIGGAGKIIAVTSAAPIRGLANYSMYATGAARAMRW